MGGQNAASDFGKEMGGGRGEMKKARCSEPHTGEGGGDGEVQGNDLGEPRVTLCGRTSVWPLFQTGCQEAYKSKDLKILIKT